MTATDQDELTEIFEDVDLEPGCEMEWVGNPEECPNKADFLTVTRCCGHETYLCTPCVDSVERFIERVREAGRRTQCSYCGTTFTGGFADYAILYPVKP